MNYTILGIFGLTIIIMYIFRKKSVKEGLNEESVPEETLEPPSDKCDGQWSETKGQIGGDVITDCKYGSSIKNGKCGWSNVIEAKKGCWEWPECGGFTCKPNKKTGFCQAASVNQSACLNVTNVETHVFDSFHKVGGKCNVKPQDCIWGAWGEWNKCAGKCGEPGSQTRTRKKIKEEEDGGKCEGKVTEKRPCKPEPGSAIKSDAPPDYTTACEAPKSALDIPYISQLPSPPSAVSLLGGQRPTAMHKPATVEEDAHNRISYWQDKKNHELVTKSIVVAENLKKQQEVEKNDPILGRDYTKPDLRMFPLLKSISNSLKSLSTS